MQDAGLVTRLVALLDSNDPYTLRAAARAVEWLAAYEGGDAHSLMQRPKLRDGLLRLLDPDKCSRVQRAGETPAWVYCCLAPSSLAGAGSTKSWVHMSFSWLRGVCRFGQPFVAAADHQVAMGGELTRKKRTAALAARLASSITWVLKPHPSLLMHDSETGMPWPVFVTGDLEDSALVMLNGPLNSMASDTAAALRCMPNLQVVSSRQIGQLSPSALLQAPLPSPACAGVGGWHPRCSFRAQACSPGCAPSSLTRWVDSICQQRHAGIPWHSSICYLPALFAGCLPQHTPRLLATTMPGAWLIPLTCRTPSGNTHCQLAQLQLLSEMLPPPAGAPGCQQQACPSASDTPHLQDPIGQKYTPSCHHCSRYLG